MSSIWAIADLHLHLQNPEKSMDRFGPIWENHAEKIAHEWASKVKKDDLVLLGGDLSWAGKLDKAKADLDFIGALAGNKLIIEGNHDYWWSSFRKMKEAMHPSMHILTEEPFLFEGIYIVGTRLWDGPEFSFYPQWIEPLSAEEKEKNNRIFAKEMARLERSLQKVPKNAPIIAMTHYPPIGPDWKGRAIHEMYRNYGVKVALFGHLHFNQGDLLPTFGMFEGIFYQLISFDYLKGSLFRVERALLK